MHRNLTDRHTSRIIIYKDKMVCENPDSFGTMGIITQENFVPIAKNPTLAKFFRQIGYADELGSGVRKITKYSYLYSGDYPVFEDKEMFKVTIPLNKVKNTFDIDDGNKSYGSLAEKASYQLYNQIFRKNHPKKSSKKYVLKDILKYIEDNKVTTKKEIIEALGFSEGQVKYAIKCLKENNLIEVKGYGRSTYYKKI